MQKKYKDFAPAYVIHMFKNRIFFTFVEFAKVFFLIQPLTGQLVNHGPLNQTNWCAWASHWWKSLIEKYFFQRSLLPPQVATSGALHMRHFCNLGVFSFLIHSFIQNDLSLKKCVQISNRFQCWIYRAEIFKSRSYVDRFWRAFCFKENQTKRPDREQFFPFPEAVSKRHGRASCGSKIMPLAEAKPCFSRKKTCFFPFPKGTTVPLAEAKPCLSRKEKK